MTTFVRRATIADAERLSRFGAATFHDTFESENTPENMAHYLAQTFTPEMQSAEIADASNTVLLAERQTPAKETELVGYAHLASGPAPAAVRGPTPMELKRLYVARAWHGQGIAQTLMEAALDAARSLGTQTLWLGVWERNPRAAAFYGKCGFARVGEHPFLLGADAQTDWLLARSL